MKIVFLARLYKPHIGGVEKHLQKISHLLSHDNQVTIITEQYSPDLPISEISDGITILRIPVSHLSAKTKKWFIWKWFFDHANILDTADIIHCHDVVYWTYFYKLLHLNKPIFATFHGWEGIYPIPQTNKLKRKLDAKLVSGNICIGTFIEKWYGIRANYISYGAVDAYKSSQKPSNTLLFLGRLDSDTGLTDCINKYQLLKPKLHWSLSVVGDGPLKPLLPKSAVFHGWQPKPQEYIEGAKYVYATGYLGILEALSAGKPVLCSYDNPVKKDYINTHPMSMYFTFSDTIPSNLPSEAVNWAKAQSWDNLVEIYRNLWQIQ